VLEGIRKKSPKRQLRAFPVTLLTLGHLKESSASSLEAQRGILFLSWLPAVCKVGGLFILLLVEVCCRECGLQFYVCRRCWRGQAYCREACRRLGQRRVHREAQRRYRQSQKGKRAHRQGENRRRHGWSTKNEKKMDDHTSRGWASHGIGFSISSAFLRERCHFCGCRGRVVERFPRRH